MPIPQRLRPSMPSVEEMHEYTELCRRIENGRYADTDELDDLLRHWNRRAGTAYVVEDFRAYYGSMEIDEFVGRMLMGTPQLVPDLTYAELRDVLDEQVSVSLSEPEQHYYLDWLDANLPGANVSDLIYWPNEWFKNESLLQVEFTPDQILAYVMAKSGRSVTGAPAGVPMPYPIPTDA